MQEIILENKKVLPGTYKLIQLPIANLPSGTLVNINAHVFNADNDGPVVLFAGGLHGDEINGVEIVRKAIELNYFSNLKCGAVIAIPLINTLGFINYARETSGKDVNRSFPGSTKGSLASLIAHTITNKILPLINYGIDFHTGGASVYNYPQLRVSREDDFALELAQQTSIPFIIQKKTIPNSHRKQALNIGKTLLVFEGGESLRLDSFSIAEGLKAIQQLLVAKEMIQDSKDEKQDSTVFIDSKWQRSSKSGIFTPYKKAGETVIKGEFVAEVNHLNPLSKTKIKAAFSGVLIGHRNNPVVNKGDAIFHIAIKG